MKYRTAALALVAVTVAGSGCGGEEPGTPTKPADHTVTVTNYKFEPKTLTVKPGQTVEWVFAQGTHDVVSGKRGTSDCTADGKFKSELMSKGTFRHTFATAGTFDYFCSPHCVMEGQVGTVTVAP